MKVLQVINHLLVAGAQVLVRNMILGLTHRGIECELYLLQSTDSPIESSLLREAVRLYFPLRTSIYSPLHARSLAAHLRDHSYDVVHVHLFPAQLWVALASKLANATAPLVTTEHNTYNRRRRPIYRPMDRWMYAQYRFIASISEATTEALVRCLPELAGKARTCPNGIDVDSFASAPASNKFALLSLPDHCPVILSVGRLEFQKDHETVIRAMSLIQDAHLAVVGVGPRLEELESLARKLRVANRVHFLGQRTDVPQLMKAADVYVQSSRWEGFGIAALEAMASGLPVVASRVPGLAELVGDTGLLFEPGDHQQLAEHLATLINREELRARLAKAGQPRAAAFSFDRTLDCYENLYRELLPA
jgi:glycosyltransferase involved in cell wall biosynthesis